MQKRTRPLESKMNSSTRAHNEDTPHRSACGRLGCITIYMSEDCHLCEAMDKYLQEVVKSEGLSENIINRVYRNSVLAEPNFDEILSVPAVRICQMVLTGLPDDERMRSSLRSAANKECFLEDIT